MIKISLIGNMTIGLKVQWCDAAMQCGAALVPAV